MRPPTLRRKTEPSVPAQPSTPRYATIEKDGRVDLTCTVCSRPIAYGVHPERLEVDGAFFIDAHAPNCLCVVSSRPAGG